MVNLQVWQLWVIAALVLFIAEMLLANFLLASFGVAALASALVSFLGLGIEIQVLTFSIAALAVFVWIRPFFWRYLYASSAGVKTNVEGLVGKAGVVSERIDPAANRGRAVVQGNDWRCASVDERVIDVGERIRVVAVEGTKLLVELESEREK